jgi:hypothetical protein
MGYFLAHNSIDIFHYGEISQDQVVSTGQPNLEFFDTLEELKTRLMSFGVVCGDDNNPNDLDILLEGDVS